MLGDGGLDAGETAIGDLDSVPVKEFVELTGGRENKLKFFSAQLS